MGYPKIVVGVDYCSLSSIVLQLGGSNFIFYDCQLLLLDQSFLIKQFNPCLDNLPILIQKQEQAFAFVFHYNFKKLCKIQGKTPVLESLFNKVGGLKARNFIKKIL